MWFVQELFISWFLIKNCQFMTFTSVLGVCLFCSPNIRLNNWFNENKGKFNVYVNSLTECTINLVNFTRYWIDVLCAVNFVCSRKKTLTSLWLVHVCCCYFQWFIPVKWVDFMLVEIVRNKTKLKSIRNNWHFS